MTRAIMDWLNKWLGALPSTSATIVVGLALAVIYVIWALLADTLGHPLAEATLNTVGLFVSAMVTAGVTQFAVKRRTDDNFVAAKTGAKPVTPRGTTALPAVGADATP